MVAFVVLAGAVLAGCSKKIDDTIPFGLANAPTTPSTLPDGTVLVTMSNDGETLPVAVGADISVDLVLPPGVPGYMPLQSTDSSILAPRSNTLPTPNERRGIFRAVRTGQAQIRSAPPHLPSECPPRCVPTIGYFYVTILVH